MRNARHLACCLILIFHCPVFAADAPPIPSSKPNIVIILADDMGFSDLGCYGGEIETPNIDNLAKAGIRFTQMYNTARCWPTRACIQTGYYAQQVNRDPANKRPPWAPLLPHLLKPAGYRSYHSGKWHIDGSSAAGGFDHSYRLEDHNHYFSPDSQYLDDKPLARPEKGEKFYVTTALADHAIDFLKEHRAEHAKQPFYLYLAFTSPHFPLQALEEDIARYKEKYLAGWDVIRQQRWQRLRDAGIVNCELSERDPKFTPRYFKPEYLKTLGPGEEEHALAWIELTAEQKSFQANKMAIHAAMVDRMDREIGRVLEQLRAMNAWDDTLIIFLSDNGADATVMVRGDGHDQHAPMGSAATFLCLGPGWASASNAPFRRHKVWVHEGGISTSCIFHFPDRIKGAGELCHSPAHVIDFIPTILELAGADSPAKWKDEERPPLPGKSLMGVFEKDAPVSREAIYWQHEGNRAIRFGDMKLVSEAENESAWELYDLSTDRIESKNLAAAQPEKVKEMSALWEKLDKQFHEQGGGVRSEPKVKKAKKD